MLCDPSPPAYSGVSSPPVKNTKHTTQALLTFLPSLQFPLSSLSCCLFPFRFRTSIPIFIPVSDFLPMLNVAFLLFYFKIVIHHYRQSDCFSPIISSLFTYLHSILFTSTSFLNMLSLVFNFLHPTPALLPLSPSSKFLPFFTELSCSSFSLLCLRS